MDSRLLQEFDAVERERNRRLGKTDIIAFAHSVNMTPDPWQEAVLKSVQPRLILNCSRQAGKSTCAGIIALHTAYYTPKQLILIFSPSERQSTEILRKVLDYCSNLPVKPKLATESKTVLEFPNGSRIISLPATESTVRTYTVDLIIEDESGDVPDDLNAAILPMVIVSRGRMILMGTPKGRRGHFFESWERGGDGWERFKVSASDVVASGCTRVNKKGERVPVYDPADLAIQKIALRELYAQEFECQFISGGGGLVYGSFDEKRNLIDRLPPLQSTQGWTYMLGLDFGFIDSTAFVLVGYRPDDPTVYVILSFKEPGLTPSQVGEKVSELQATYKFSMIVGDTGGMGKGYSEEIRRRFHIPVETAEKQNKRGFIDLLNGDMASGRIKMLGHANQGLIAEMANLPWNESRSRPADGFEDHLCDAFLYIWRKSTAYLKQEPLEPQRLSPGQQTIIDAKKFTKNFWEQDERKRQNDKFMDSYGAGFDNSESYSDEDL